MLHIKTQKKTRAWPSYLCSALLLAAVLFLFSTGVGSVSRRTQAEQQNALSEAIRRACVQCYAIEGRYPPSVEYLEEHYGISIDRSRYYVFYDGWASNIMPDITIFPAQES